MVFSKQKLVEQSLIKRKVKSNIDKGRLLNMALKKTKLSKRQKLEQSKACGALSYLLFGIIWFFMDEKMRNDKFAAFHVGQAIVFLITAAAVNILNSVLWIIPFFGIFTMAVLQIVLLVLFVYGVVMALTGQKKELPMIGHFARQFRL